MKFEKNPNALYSKESMLRRLDEADKETGEVCRDVYDLSRTLDELAGLLHHCSESGDDLEISVADLKTAKESVYTAYQNIRKVFKTISGTKDIVLK